MSFFSLSNIYIRFAETSDFIWRNYTIIEALPFTKRVELIDRKEFAKANLDENAESFMVHITTSLALSIQPSQKTQLGL